MPLRVAVYVCLVPDSSYYAQYQNKVQVYLKFCSHWQEASVNKKRFLFISKCSGHLENTCAYDVHYHIIRSYIPAPVERWFPHHSRLLHSPGSQNLLAETNLTVINMFRKSKTRYFLVRWNSTFLKAAHSIVYCLGHCPQITLFDREPTLFTICKIGFSLSVYKNKNIVRSARTSI